MLRAVFGIIVILVGLLYFGAIGLAIWNSGDPANGTAGLTPDKLFDGVVLLPIGVLAIWAGFSILLAARRS